MQIQAIVSYDGYIYALINKELYMIDDIDDKKWEWKKVEWAPADIINITTTYDNANLWIQTSTKGMLYGADNEKISEEEYMYNRRNYGKDSTTYIDIYNNTAIYQGKKIANIVDAILSYYGDVISIKIGDSYNKLRMINWKPYYL